MREETLYHVLEELLPTEAKKAVTCNDLFDRPRVKKHANNPNRVSDYLANLWRRGTASRVPAPKTRDSVGARWAYFLKPKNKIPADVVPIDALTEWPAAHAVQKSKGQHPAMFVTPHMKIYGEGEGVRIELKTASILIEPRE